MDIKSYVLGFAKGKAEGGSGDSGGSIVGSGDGLETRSGSFRAPNTYIAFFDESDLSKSTSYSHLYYGEFITDKTIETDKQYQLLDTIGIFTPFSKNISGLGTCVCFGNENILVNDTVEPGEQAFLIAYSPSTSKIVVFSLSVHSFTISGRSELLYRVTVPHGFNQKPDLIMVYSDSTTNSMGITSAWGYSSKYRSIIENLNHLTYTYTGWMGYSSVKGIDEEQTGSYLYCDETNFYLGGSIPFVCGGTYKWIAVTGLGSTGTSGSGDGTSTDERVKYVTFMYGATELIKYPVISGDTVHDPVAKGLIDAPTKESTVSHVYSFGGWSMTDGGSPSASALQNVTEDRTVYAALNAQVRYYTVRFYDGDTLVNSEQVAYGGSSYYYYEKDGYTFNGWLPEPTNITGDLDCVASLTEKMGFAAATWEQVIEKAKDGTAYTEWAVGDTKDLTLNYSDGTSETVTVMLANKSKCNLEDGTKDNMSIVLTQPLQKMIPFMTILAPTSSGFDATAYNALNFPTFLRETVFPALPQELQDAIKPRKYYAGVVYVNNKLWGISSSDIGLGLTDAVLPKNTNTIMTPRNSTEPVIWYTGNMYSAYSKIWPRGYGTDGNMIKYNSNYSFLDENTYKANNGVVFGFCL